MKLFKKLAASMMCLLLAVCVFVGCSSSQFKQAKLNVPSDEKFAQNEVTEDADVIEALTLLTQQASTVTDEQGNVIFEGNGALEALIRNAKISIEISKINPEVEAPEDEVVDGPEAANDDGGELDAIFEQLATILEGVQGSIKIAGVMKLKDGSIQLALDLDSDVTLTIPSGETDTETGAPINVTYTLSADANLYYKNGYLYAKVAVANGDDKAEKMVKVALPLVLDEETEEGEAQETINPLYFGAQEAIKSISGALANLAETLKDEESEEERAELLEMIKMAEIYKVVEGSKTYYKLVFGEEIIGSLDFFEGIGSVIGPVSVYLQFNNGKLTKVSATTVALGYFGIQVVLEKYTDSINFPSFKNYEAVENMDAFEESFAGLLEVFAPLADLFGAR